MSIFDYASVDEILDYLANNNQDKVVEAFNNDIWTTKDEGKIPIVEMSNRHLDSAIAFIEREGDRCLYGYGEFWLLKLINERDERRQSR